MVFELVCSVAFHIVLGRPICLMDVVDKSLGFFFTSKVTKRGELVVGLNSSHKKPYEILILGRYNGEKSPKHRQAYTDASNKDSSLKYIVNDTSCKRTAGRSDAGLPCMSKKARSAIFDPHGSSIDEHNPSMLMRDTAGLDSCDGNANVLDDNMASSTTKDEHATCGDVLATPCYNMPNTPCNNASTSYVKEKVSTTSFSNKCDSGVVSDNMNVQRYEIEADMRTKTQHEAQTVPQADQNLPRLVHGSNAKSTRTVPSTTTTFTSQSLGLDSNCLEDPALAYLGKSSVEMPKSERTDLSTQSKGCLSEVESSTGTNNDFTALDFTILRSEKWKFSDDPKSFNTLFQSNDEHDPVLESRSSAKTYSGLTGPAQSEERNVSKEYKRKQSLPLHQVLCSVPCRLHSRKPPLGGM